MLGLVYVSSDEVSSAEHYLKRALKVLQDQGNLKLVKEVKLKLSALKDGKEKKGNMFGSTK